MVSHGAPVYWGERFVGVVGTDVLLAFLGDFLGSFPDPEGVLLIVNEHGQILGERRASEPDAVHIQGVADVLPALGAGWRAPLQGRGAPLGADRLFVAAIDNPHWQVVHVLPQALITQRVLRAYAAPLALGALLVAAAFVMQWMLWRMYVAPALQIARFVARESGGGSAAVPVLPGAWQPWIAAMAQAFADRRYYLLELEAGKEALERRVDERTQALLAANQHLERLAVTDPLTGAANRRQLFVLLEQERQRIVGREDGMAILLIDLDHFKRINDHFGHAAGDAVLCEFVRRSRAAVRSTDSVCRYGGEEFVILLPGLACAAALALGERLRKVVADEPVEFDGQRIPVTISIGATVYRTGEGVEEMLARADQLLYRAKHGGRNRLEVAEDATALGHP